MEILDYSNIAITTPIEEAPLEVFRAAAVGRGSGREYKATHADVLWISTEGYPASPPKEAAAMCAKLLGDRGLGLRAAYIRPTERTMFLLVEPSEGEYRAVACSHEPESWRATDANWHTLKRVDGTWVVTSTSWRVGLE